MVRENHMALEDEWTPVATSCMFAPYRQFGQGDFVITFNSLCREPSPNFASQDFCPWMETGFIALTLESAPLVLCFFRYCLPFCIRCNKAWLHPLSSKHSMHRCRNPTTYHEILVSRGHATLSPLTRSTLQMFAMIWLH